ncbi:MAG TPA: transglycosylase SLT domain-containing protein [Nitrosomonas sp.]|nr:transglycosylase SLT domain-containing protein [Nitrosomonas sp.]
MHLKKWTSFLILMCSLALLNTAEASNRSPELKNQAFQHLTDEASIPFELVQLAKQHEHAEGIPRNYNRAAELYCEAAGLGYDEAQYALGWMYANGRGVPRNDSIAAQLFGMAAEQGHAHAGKMMRYLDDSLESALPECMQSVAENDLMDFVDKPYFDLVVELAPRYDLDPALVMAIITVESAFNVQAVSHKNAQGLMQLIPETAERFQVKNTFDAEENIKGGMAYLRWLLAFFKGDVTLAVAAYNAGEGAVERHQGIPPYTETKNYVKKIQAQYAKSTHPYQPDIVHRHAVIALSEYE